jgi:predicted GIY-YIG superfamily endonuclease
MKIEYIYIIYEGDDRFKIGRSNNIHKRIESYKTHNSQIEGYLAVFEVKDSKLSEKALHRRYEPYRINREFFELPLEELKSLEDKIIGLKKSYLSGQYLEFINSI